MIFEHTIVNDVYDLIFKNTQHEVMDFCKLFDEAYADFNNASIYLLTSDNTKPQFKIKVERI